MAITIENYLKEITTLADERNAFSMAWYRKQVTELGPMAGNIKLTNAKTRPTYGIMNLFYYSPKYESTLPYYDALPLSIPIEKTKNGFVGINFHYLPIPLRIKLFEKMEGFTQEQRIIGWRSVSKIKEIKPCVKRYISANIVTKVMPIKDEDMRVAVLLPIQRFKEASAPQVWSESRKKM